MLSCFVSHLIVYFWISYLEMCFQITLTMFAWFFICHSLLHYIYIYPVYSLVMFGTWSCAAVNCVALGCWFDITYYALISYYVYFYTAISFMLLALFLVFYSLPFDIWSKYSCLIYIYIHMVCFQYFFKIIVLCLQWNMWEHHVNMCTCWFFEYVQWFDGFFFVDHILAHLYIYTFWCSHPFCMYFIRVSYSTVFNSYHNINIYIYKEREREREINPGNF